MSQLSKRARTVGPIEFSGSGDVAGGEVADVPVDQPSAEAFLAAASACDVTAFLVLVAACSLSGGLDYARVKGPVSCALLDAMRGLVSEFGPYLSGLSMLCAALNEASAIELGLISYPCKPLPLPPRRVHPCFTWRWHTRTMIALSPSCRRRSATGARWTIGMR